MKKRWISALLACVMAMGTFAGCGTGGNSSGDDAAAKSEAQDNLPVDENGDPSPFGKYKDPVTVEIVQSINPSIALPDGDSATDNY